MSPREIRFRSRQQFKPPKKKPKEPKWVCEKCGGTEDNIGLIWVLSSANSQPNQNGAMWYYYAPCDDHKPSKEWKVMNILKRFKARREWLNSRK